MWKNVAQFLRKYFGGFAENATGDFKEELAESMPGDLREVPAPSVSSKDLREASMEKMPRAIAEDSAKHDLCEDHSVIVQKAQEAEHGITVQVRISAPKEVQAKVQTKVAVTIDTETTGLAYEPGDEVIVNPKSSNSSWSHEKNVDVLGRPLGKKTLKYHHLFESSTSTLLERSEIDLLSVADTFDEDDDASYYQCDDAPDAFVPSKEQVEKYYGLCRRCEAKHIPYNHRDRPTTYREYQLAIKCLSAVLRKACEERQFEPASEPLFQPVFQPIFQPQKSKALL